MNRIATVLLCTFLFATLVSATPPAAPQAPEPSVVAASPDQPLFLPGALCSGAVETATFSLKVNYCGDCAVDSQCKPFCGGPGDCVPASYNPHCGVCICF